MSALSPTARLSMVAAVAENGVIGQGGQMPWRLRDDLAWFKKVTLGKPVIMGRKTFASIGKALPGRTNIIITRNAGFTALDCVVVPSFDLALREGMGAHQGEEGQSDGIQNPGEIAIIGGGEIYRHFLPHTSRLYLTRVYGAPEGDTFFPDLYPDDWDIRLLGSLEQNARNTHACSFFVYDRKPPATTK
ncbi:MAG: dihydrofolate reductase [Pseudomonadota bacterium]